MASGLTPVRGEPVEHGRSLAENVLKLKLLDRLFSLFKGSDQPDCTEVRESSSDYIDGELPRSYAGRIRSHLDSCPPCDAFVRTLRATVGLLRSLPKERAPEGFRGRVRQSLSTDARS